MSSNGSANSTIIPDVHIAPGMHYEIHFNVAGIPNGEVGDLVREYMSDVFEKALEKTLEMLKRFYRHLFTMD